MGRRQELKDSEFEAALITLSINTKLVYKTSHISPSLLSFTSASNKDNDLEGSLESLDLSPQR